MDAEAVKFIGDPDDGVIEGLAIPFGGPVEGGRDLEGDKFTKDTAFHLDYFATRPVLYNHGTDKTLGTEQVGTQTEFKLVDDGLWARVVLDRSSRYWAKMKELVGKGVLFFSSSAMPHLVRRDRAGYVKSWPVMELSVTETPANPYAVIEGKTDGSTDDDGGTIVKTETMKLTLDSGQLREEFAWLSQSINAIGQSVGEVRSDVEKLSERIRFLEESQMQKSTKVDDSASDEEGDGDDAVEGKEGSGKGSPADSEDNRTGADEAKNAFFVYLESLANEQEENDYAKHSPH